MPNSPPSASVLYSFPTNADLLDSLATFILKAQKESINKKGRFTVALSGGSLPKQLSALVNNPAVKWDKWYASASHISSALQPYPVHPCVFALHPAIVPYFTPDNALHCTRRFTLILP